MRNLLQLLVVAAFISISCTMAQAQKPFDDFSGDFIDVDKWSPRSWHNRFEEVRQVSGGKLVAKVRGNTSNTNTHVLNQLSFANPNDIDTIQADVALIEASYSGNIFSVGTEIGGNFYEESGGTVWAFITLALTDQGYTIVYGVNSSAGFADSDPFTVDISPNTEYTLKIDYDGDNSFTFSVDGQTRTVTGPAYSGPSQREFKALTAGVWSDNSSTDPGFGYVSGTFDNVFVNDSGTAYDDFSSAPLDASIWWTDEIVREVRTDQLHMYVQNVGLNRTTTDLMIAEEYKTNYLQADVSITDDTILTGTNATYGEARVYGRYFNYKHDGSGYDNEDGEIYAMARIRRFTDGTMYARASVLSCDNNDCSSETSHLSQNFSCSVELNTPVTLSVEKLSNGFIFGCNDETIPYSFDFPVYNSQYDDRVLRSRLYSTSGESGYFYATFDNVYTKKGFPWANFLPSMMNKKE